MNGTLWCFKFCWLLILMISLSMNIGCSNNEDTTSDTQVQNKSPLIQESSATEETPAPSQKVDSTKVTFIELGSVNCIPCKMMQPVMKEIEEQYSSQVNVLFYDVWTAEGSPYGQQYGIRVIPTQVFLDKEGKEFFRHEGYFPKEDIVKILQDQGVK